MQDQINLFFESLELSNTGYTVSFFQIITDINFDNRQIKNLPNDRKKLQMFFLRIFVMVKLLNPFAVKQMTM